MKNKLKILSLFLAATIFASACGTEATALQTMSAERTEQFREAIRNVAESIAEEKTVSPEQEKRTDANEQAEVTQSYIGSPYCVLDGNKPDFPDADKTTEAFESYSDLDSLGRCGVAYANICKELMPTEKRGEIGMIKPTGWHTVRYDDIIQDKYLYNRCHLIGFQLAGENANEKNLVTGTRYMNVDGMLPFENMVADYVQETNHHVLYRVTPVFEGNDLVCRGVEMEAYSVEDHGEDVSFHVFVYNVQPGIEIDYATGDSHVAGGESGQTASEQEESQAGEDDVSNHETSTYVVNTNTGKFHRPDCDAVEKIARHNRKDLETDRETLIAQGYTACGICKP